MTVALPPPGDRPVIAVEFVSRGEPADDCALAVLAFETGVLTAPPFVADAQFAPARRAMAAAGFDGAAGETFGIAVPSGLDLLHLLIVGAGAPNVHDPLASERAGALAWRAARHSGATTLLLAFDRRPAHAARGALGAVLAAYRFDRYRTHDQPVTGIRRIRVVTSDPAGAETIWAGLKAVAEGVFLARDLVNEPANVMTPREFVRRLAPLAALGVAIDVLDEDAMQQLGMHALLSVGAGSPEPSYLAVLRWNGTGDPAAAPVCIVGKGVCFDSGGLNIKSAATAIEYMKFDMGGAAAVAGTMHALAARRAEAHVVGIVGLVENMTDGAATRPGDVVPSMRGKTIEVVNTDAEGRLVLADALWYGQQRFRPRALVDIATLTGSMDISLGHDLAGFFSNDDQLAAAIRQAGLDEDEPLWRMPLQPTYRRQLDSLIADMRNVGETNGRSITAALFLEAFVENVPWAHLDINAVVWRRAADDPACPPGASGFGVRVLNRLIADHHETPQGESGR